MAAPIETYDSLRTTLSTLSALTFLRSIYNDPSEAKSVRMRAAIEALSFETPKLAVTASLNGGDFAKQLEKAVRRSEKVIEHREPQILPDLSSAST